VQAHLVNKFGAQMDVMAEVVNANLQTLQRKDGSEAGEPRRSCFFRVAPKAENRDARHL
jgi:hypothetical protein